MDLRLVLESKKRQNREEVLSVLKKKGIIRLSEAGPNLRVYNFAAFSGERIKFCLYNDGTYEIQH